MLGDENEALRPPEVGRTTLFVWRLYQSAKRWRQAGMGLTPIPIAEINDVLDDYALEGSNRRWIKKLVRLADHFELELRARADEEGASLEAAEDSLRKEVGLPKLDRDPVRTEPTKTEGAHAMLRALEDT